ncbi:MAG: hypothetical protein WBO46_23710 [Caldilineaceae bacterium]
MWKSVTRFLLCQMTANNARWGIALHVFFAQAMMPDGKRGADGVVGSQPKPILKNLVAAFDIRFAL